MKKKILILICFVLLISCGSNSKSNTVNKTSNKEVKTLVQSACSKAVSSTQKVSSSQIVVNKDIIKEKTIKYLTVLISELKKIEIKNNPKLQKDLKDKIKYTKEYLVDIKALHLKYEKNNDQYYKSIEFIKESSDLAKKLNVNLFGNKIEEYCTFSNEELAGE